MSRIRIVDDGGLEWSVLQYTGNTRRRGHMQTLELAAKVIYAIVLLAGCSYIVRMMWQALHRPKDKP